VRWSPISITVLVMAIIGQLDVGVQP